VKGVDEKMIFAIGDAAQLASHYAKAIFDVVLCHNVLQYVEDVTAVSLPRRLLPLYWNKGIKIGHIQFNDHFA